MQKKKKRERSKKVHTSIKRKTKWKFPHICPSVGQAEGIPTLLVIYECTSQYHLFDKSLRLSSSFFPWKYRSQEIVGKMQRSFWKFFEHVELTFSLID